MNENDLTIRELRDGVDEFEKAQALIDEAEHGPEPLAEDPAECYNCGAYAKTLDGHTYVCPLCGDEWDVWLDPLGDL